MCHVAALRCCYSHADAGWGCTLRSQQSQLSAGLFRSGFSPLQVASTLLSPRGALSFYNLQGATRQPEGQWVAPTAAAAAASCLLASPSSSPFSVLHCKNGVIPPATLVERLASRSVLLLLPLRLSPAETLGELVGARLARLFTAALPQFVGGVGGPPGHCVFLLPGDCPSRALAHDPHTIKPPASTPEQLLELLLPTRTPTYIGYKDLSTSISLGFFFKDAAEWGAFQSAHFSPSGIFHHLPSVCCQQQAAVVGPLHPPAPAELEEVPPEWVDVGSAWHEEELPPPSPLPRVSGSPAGGTPHFTGYYAWALIALLHRLGVTG